MRDNQLKAPLDELNEALARSPENLHLLLSGALVA